MACATEKRRQHAAQPRERRGPGELALLDWAGEREVLAHPAYALSRGARVVGLDERIHGDEREGLEVEAADQQLAPVDHGGLGVQHGAIPFPDAHAAREERRVDVAHGEPGQRHVAVRRQEHLDFDAALGRGYEGAQHWAVGKEISLRKLDGGARPAERPEVAASQPPAAAAIGEVDADGPLRLSNPLMAQLAREPGAGDAPDLDGKVGPADVATVDAAHERDAIVDEEELAMIARQRAEQEPPAPGVDADRAAGGDQLRFDLARVFRRAPSVERYAHGNAAGRGG